MKKLIKKILFPQKNINEKSTINNDKIKLFCKEFNVDINNSSQKWIIDSMDFINNIKVNCRDFEIDLKENIVNVKIENLYFKVSNRSEFLILKEVFVDGVYNFNLNDEVVIFDIGMNIGISTLFFAQKSNVKNVYSYEPVDDTYNTALINIGLNNLYSSKVNAKNAGLFSSTTRQKFTYNPNNKGSFGFVGNKKFDKDSFEEKEVQLVDIKLEIGEILQHTNLPYIMKIDCEGAEYDIIPELKKLNRLPLLIMMEWHLSKGNELVDELVLNNYNVIYTRTEKTAGMIYAYLIK